MSRIFFFGYGYTAAQLAKLLREDGWAMAGTTGDQKKVNRMWEHGVEPHIWSGEDGPLEAPMRVMHNVTHILHTLPVTAKGDVVLRNHARLLKTIAPRLEWYGYVSSTSVYGDTHGEVAREDFEPNPTTPRGKFRLRVEQRHLQFKKKAGLPVHIFRAGEVYGPGRSAMRRAALAEPPLVHKEGHTRSRIHVEDLAQIIYASMKKPNPGSIYNCVDDLATGPEVPLELAYEMLGKPKPPLVQYDEVKEGLELSMASQYQESRLISNAKIKSELGVELKYPTYKEGFEALNEARLERVRAR